MRTSVLAAFVVAGTLLAPSEALTHCDALDGPVVKDARRALDSGDVMAVLMWVPAADEAELRSVFSQVLSTRKAGGAALEVADRHFFETVVRLHRRGEGEPFTGLRPAGGIEPAIAAADEALVSGSVETLAAELAKAAEHGLRERFARASQARRRAADGVEAGRAYVSAYAEFVHYAERLHRAAHTGAHGPAGHAQDHHE